MINPDRSYRPDIDGLRAIAVLSVIAFHMYPRFLPGGFVGVDIFFVISGYLISQRIIAGHEQGGFSFKQFYIRRIRRLFPAVISTVLLTMIYGSLFLTPDDLIGLSKSAISAVFSAANIHFFLEAGYWDVESWRKPLLHMWSLSVEEQFYVVWPFLIIGILKFSKHFSFLVLMAITVLSLLVTSFYTSKNPSAAFYLTPFRVYEFGIGAACV